MTTLTMKDEKRIEVIQRVFRGELTVGEAAMILGVSERQCYRIKVRIKEQGAQGVVHGNRGRACQRKVKNKTVQRIVELAQGKYHGFNDHHLTEKLKEHEKISYGVSAYSDEATINRAGGNLVLRPGALSDNKPDSTSCTICCLNAVSNFRCCFPIDQLFSRDHFTRWLSRPHPLLKFSLLLSS